MFKNLICFLGLCSVIHAANINIVEVQAGKEASRLLRPVVLSGTEKKLDEVKEQLDEIGIHIYIDLDGKVTCFVPSDSQLENVQKFPSKAAEVRGMREKIKNINNYDPPALAYFYLADCITEKSYATTQLCTSDPECIESVNIMLQRRSLESCDIICDVRRDHSSQEISQEMSALQDDPEALMAYKIDFLKNGYMTGYNVKLYTDEQIDVTYSIVDSLVNLVGALVYETRITSRSHPNDFYALSCFFWPQLLSKYPNPDFYKPEPLDEIRD